MGKWLSRKVGYTSNTKLDKDNYDYSMHGMRDPIFSHFVHVPWSTWIIYPYWVMVINPSLEIHIDIRLAWDGGPFSILYPLCLVTYPIVSVVSLLLLVLYHAFPHIPMWLVWGYYLLTNLDWLRNPVLIDLRGYTWVWFWVLCVQNYVYPHHFHVGYISWYLLLLLWSNHFSAVRYVYRKHIYDPVVI